jgi:hypothetical protein
MPPLTHLRASLPLLSLFLWGAVGCQGDFPGAGTEPTITEDAFVEAMAELRVAAWAELDGVLPETKRDEILARRGLDPEDLLHFVEVRGLDVPGMHAVWVRVDEAVSQGRAELDVDQTESSDSDATDPS